MILATTTLIAATLAYACALTAWWPALTNPNHYLDQAIAEREWIVWAQSLVVTPWPTP